MMLTATLSILFAVAVIATALSLIDSWFRASHAFAVLRRERALLAAGFVPQLEASEVRLRADASRARIAQGHSRNVMSSARRGRARAVLIGFEGRTARRA